MVSRASRWSWAKLTIAWGGTLPRKLPRTSSGTNRLSVAAATVGSAPPVAAPAPDGGGGATLATPTGADGPDGKPKTIGRCGQMGWRGGLFVPTGEGSTTMREPRRRLPQWEPLSPLLVTPIRLPRAGARSVWRWPTPWKPECPPPRKFIATALSIPVHRIGAAAIVSHVSRTVRNGAYHRRARGAEPAARPCMPDCC